MERYILDTSIFTNPDVVKQFGDDFAAAITVYGLASSRPRMSSFSSLRYP